MLQLEPRLWFCGDVGAMYITCMGTVTTNDLRVLGRLAFSAA